MTESACDASLVIFTEFNWISHCGGDEAHKNTGKVVLIHSLANCSTGEKKTTSQRKVEFLQENVLFKLWRRTLE